MKITGIVCEYNPMHNGHIYHIDRTRKNGSTHIIALMSGSFVQRGEAALMDKHRRAFLALKGGADLVIEIPAVYCLASAEFYARGAVSVLNSLECVDEISFGSECGSTDLLYKAAEAVRSISRSDIESKMKSGMTYPAAATSLINEMYGSELADIISSPNNILGVEYLNALCFLDSDIKPFTVKRTGAAHDSDNISGKFASASYIRKLIHDKENFSSFVPEYVRDEYYNAYSAGKTSDMKNLERVILYKLRTVSPSELASVPDVGQGLEYRLKQAADSQTISELLERVKTKRYTMARLKRILLNMLIGITSDDLKILPPYARILAFNERGREILALCKESRIPVMTSLSKLSETGKSAERFAFLEGTASDIYGLSQNIPGSKKDDYGANVRIVKNEI